MSMENRTTYVLWTGGWDSTFRMLQLAVEKHKGDTIQPIYVIGDNRPSEAREIETMASILPELRSRSQAELEDVLLIDKASIPEDARISAAFAAIRQELVIGTQYEYLARLTKEYPFLEIEIEKPNGEYSGCVAAIQRMGAMIERDGSYFLDPERSSESCVLLFGGFSFPLFNTTETGMVRWVQENGGQEIMRKIWFCHHPLHGEPCGICRPCQQKMECEMAWLLPSAGQKRYRAMKRVQLLLGEELGQKAAKRIYY